MLIVIKDSILRTPPRTFICFSPTSAGLLTFPNPKTPSRYSETDSLSVACVNGLLQELQQRDCPGFSPDSLFIDCASQRQPNRNASVSCFGKLLELFYQESFPKQGIIAHQYSTFIFSETARKDSVFIESLNFTCRFSYYYKRGR